jgi:hypothetical protein
MHEQQGYGAPNGALLVHVVYAERAMAIDVDIMREIW